ncbi:MAG: polysulfide reductase NrfD [Candidatus Lambdaproteobacteria bacterium]|nr:polysulfide reductase NrfD [Candidatus Lambdaproteobacteria bacterium]
MYGFVIDNRRCIGCHACTLACKAEHNTPVGVNRTWVKYVEKGLHPHTRRVFTVNRCNHCGDAPCVTICPVRSLFVRDNGIVDFDNQRCIGCKACMQACPYDALHIDPATRTSSKCNYCAHRVDEGLEPACVIVCPVQAIVSGDLADAASPIAQLVARQAVAVRKPEKGTRPHLYYIEGDAAALGPTDAPPRLSYTQAEQSSGVGHFAAHAAEPVLDGGPALREKVLGPDAPREGQGGDAAGDGAARRVYDAPARGVLWDWEVVGYLWTKSIAAGLIGLPLLLELLGAISLSPRLAVALAVLSLVFLGLTGALLVKDLDRPERFLYVLLRPQWRSWLTRGAYIITAFGAATTLWLGLLLAGFGHDGALPWLHGLLVLLAALTAIYTAFLFAQAKGRDAWQSPLLPLHMLLRSVLTGGSAMLLLGLLLQQHDLSRVTRVLVAVLLANGLLLAAEFTQAHVTRDTARALHLMTRGPLRLPFWTSVALGSVLPMLLLAGGQDQFRAGLWIIPAAVLVLTLSLVTEHVWVRAPQLIPLR